MATLLKGKPVADAINSVAQQEAQRLKAQNVTPTLAIVRVGDNPDDIYYEKSAAKRCEANGAACRIIELEETVTQAKLVQTIEQLNADATVHGVLLMRPLPHGIDEDTVRNTLAAEKDVDGITNASLAGVFTGDGTGFAPCTARACIEVLDYYDIDPTGQPAVVIGRSLVVGKPLAMMLVARNATVTICHTRTQNIEAVCQKAALLFVSAGRAGVVSAGHLAAGQTVIDVGINVNDDGKLCGDVDFAAAEKVVDAITPVPGGIGTVTTSVLVKQVVEAAVSQTAER